MTENEMRQHLVDAIKARALFYYAFYKEFSAEIGPERTAEIMKRAIYKRGVEIGKPFKEFGPGEHGRAEGCVPRPRPRARGHVQPELRNAATDAGVDIELTTCPLKDAWQEAGLTDAEIVLDDRYRRRGRQGDVRGRRLLVRARYLEAWSARLLPPPHPSWRERQVRMIKGSVGALMGVALAVRLGAGPGVAQTATSSSATSCR